MEGCEDIEEEEELIFVLLCNAADFDDCVSSHPSMQRDFPQPTIYLTSLTPEDKLELGLSSESVDLGSEHSNSPKSPFFASKLWSSESDNIHNNQNNLSHDIENSLSENVNTISPNSDNSNNSSHSAVHSNSFPNFTATGSPLSKNQKLKSGNNNNMVDTLPSPNGSDGSNSNNNSLSKKKMLNNKDNSSNFHEKTENLLQPRGRMKRAYSDIFFQMAPPENHTSTSTSTSTTAANTRTNSTTGSNNSDLLRLKKLAEIDRQKKKASEKKSLLGKMMSANIDIFDNSTTVRKQNEKNNEKGFITENINQNNNTAVLPYFIAKQFRKFGSCFSRSVYYFYEILVLGPHAGESNMQEGKLE